MSEEQTIETVRIDEVMVATGITSSIDGQAGLGQKVTEQLLSHARDFLIGGGSWSWRDWSALSSETRRAMVIAGVQLRNELAANIAAGIRDGDVAEALARGEPVEAVKNRRALEEAADEVVEESHAHAAG